MFLCDFKSILYMKYIFIIQKAPLHVAIENENDKIVELLLLHPEIDVNAYRILMSKILIKFYSKVYRVLKSII